MGLTNPVHAKKKSYNVTQLLGLVWNDIQNSTHRKPDGEKRGQLSQDNKILGPIKNREFVDQISEHAVSRGLCHTQSSSSAAAASLLPPPTLNSVHNKASQISNSCIPVTG
jgi:hypothetical protein